MVQNLKSEKESTLDLNLHQEENRNLKIMWSSSTTINKLKTFVITLLYDKLRQEDCEWLPITISHVESCDKNYVVFFFGGTRIFFFIHASHKHTIFSYLSIYTIQNRDLVSILSYYSTSNMEFGNNMVLAAYSPLCPNI